MTHGGGEVECTIVSTSSESNPVTVRTLLLRDDPTLLSQCEIDVYRASGPGGQKRNKTCSAVRLRHLPSKLMAIAEEDRSQHVNKRHAIFRLRLMIAYRYRLAVYLESGQVGEIICSYCQSGGGLSVNIKNPDYPLVVAELLDVIDAASARISEAASALGLTTSGVISFLRRDHKLWSTVNDMRSKHGVAPLK